MIDFIYKCTCMPDEQTIKVPYRKQDEDVTAWMNLAQQLMGKDHAMKSPRCRATAVEYAKFAISEAADGIGMEPKQ